jgi:hypothetical protein
MSPAEGVWSLGLFGVLLAAYALFVRLRRRTRDYHEARSVKRRLPPWAFGIEKSALYGLSLVASVVVFLAFIRLYRLAGIRHEIAGATLVFGAIGAILIAAPMGALLANLISWSLPALRRANETAMSGSPISFLSANQGLLWFGAATILRASSFSRSRRSLHGRGERAA